MNMDSELLEGVQAEAEQIQLELLIERLPDAFREFGMRYEDGVIVQQHIFALASSAVVTSEKLEVARAVNEQAHELSKAISHLIVATESIVAGLEDMNHESA